MKSALDSSMASDSDSDDGLAQGMDGSDDKKILLSNLVEAASNGNLEEVKLLVTEFNTHIDGIDVESGRTALQVASYQGHPDIVSYLLEKGADVNNKAGTGYAPLHLACENGAEEVIGVLLTFGADIHEREMYNKTPIYIASGRVSNDMIKMLLSVGANPCDRDFPQFNPLNPACESGQYDVVRTLLDYGASLNGWDVYGRTPLQSACYGLYQPSRWMHLVRDAHISAIELLVRGADPNIPDSRGYNTLEIIGRFCFTDDATILPILLDYGTGSGVPCHREQCGCNTTVIRCLYTSYRQNRLRQSAPRQSHDDVRDSFEMHFIKTKTVGLDVPNEENGVEPLEEDVDWSVSKREAYRSFCEAELSRMKSDPIGDTSATYFDLLTRNRSCLRDQGILRKFDGDHCTLGYPSYGNMIHCSYARLRTFFMVEECTRFFSIVSPPLLSECVEKILEYLSDKDMRNLVDIVRGPPVSNPRLVLGRP